MDANNRFAGLNGFPPPRKHQHAEAFCLMWYKCRDCPHCERIWNSRDGVTPFGTPCPSCGGDSLYHTMRGMLYAPQHKLTHGQKFWRTMTEKDVDSIRTKGHYAELTEERWKEIRLAFLEDVARGAPWLDVHVAIEGV